MLLTAQTLKGVMPLSGKRAAAFVQPLNDAMTEFGINNIPRMQAFLAQLSHESGQLVYMKELASGRAYEGRKDLGNTQKGDGVKFKGRGPIQITGRSNYEICGKALGLDLINHPELLELPEHGCRAAAWFWATHGLNELADSNTLAGFKLITRKINGGYNGLDDRLQFWKRAKLNIH